MAQRRDKSSFWRQNSGELELQGRLPEVEEMSRTDGQAAINPFSNVANISS